MRILHIMNWYVPEMGYQENFLPAFQKKLGNEVEIVTSDRVPFFQGVENNFAKKYVDRIIGEGLFNDNGIIIHRHTPILELKNEGELILKDLLKEIHVFKPDIIHSHGAFSLITLQILFLKLKFNFKIFIDDHTHYDNFHLDSISKKLFVKFLSVIYIIFNSKINMFLPVTYSSEKNLLEILKIPKNKIKILHLGSNSDIFTPSAELRKKGRSELKILDHELLIITTGKFSFFKDIHILINSFNKVLPNYPYIKLLLIGNGPIDYMLSLKQQILDLNIQDRIIFKDFIPNNQLPLFFNSSDIGIWPGEHTITVIEAIATGLPVIAPNNIMYNFLSEKKCVLPFERYNVEDLTIAIIQFIKDQKLRDEYKNNCMTITKELLSWDEIAKKSIHYYEQY